MALLWDTIREERKRSHLSMAECARRCGVGLSHQSHIEQYPTTGRLPSAGYLRRFAEEMAQTEDGRRELRLRLLLELTQIHAPEEVVEEFLVRKVEPPPEAPMPKRFIARLSRDVLRRADPERYRRAGVTGKDLDAVLDGNRRLTRGQVVALALAYDQRVSEYCLLADYLPDELYALAQLPPDDARSLLEHCGAEIEQRLPRKLRRSPGRPPREK